MRVLRPDEMFPAGVSSIATRFITTESGVRVRVAESGAKGAKPILLLHGWGCSLYAFRFLFEPLAARGYRVIAVDLKGHGLSDKPTQRAEYSLDSMTLHTVELIHSLDIRGCAILGHSMGARIACEIALREPSLGGQLLLVNPVGFGSMPHITYALPIANSFAASVFPVPFPSWLVRFPVSAVYGRIGAPTARDVEEYRAPTQFREFIVASMHLLRVFDWSLMSDSQLAEIKPRARIVVGALDRVVRIARSGRAARFIEQGWDLKIIPDVAHVVQEEVPEAVLAMERNLPATG